MQINNVIDHSIIIDRNNRFETIHNYDEKEYYVVSTKYNDLIASNFKKTFRFIKIFRVEINVFEIFAIFNVISFKFIKIVTNINITIYDIFKIQTQLISMTKSYSLL